MLFSSAKTPVLRRNTVYDFEVGKIYECGTEVLCYLGYQKKRCRCDECVKTDSSILIVLHFFDLKDLEYLKYPYTKTEILNAKQYFERVII